MKAPYIKKLTEVGNFSVFIVDGSFIRDSDKKYADFSNFAQHYCNPPDAPIWMRDFSFKPLGDIVVGDELIGWERANSPTIYKPTGGKFTTDVLCPSRVLSIYERKVLTIKLTFLSGRTLRCTKDHLWDSSESGRLATFKTPRIGISLSHVITPTPELPLGSLRDSALWLGGLYDGEGSHERIAQSSTANPFLWNEIHKVLLDLNIDHRSDNEGHYIRGGRQVFVDFYNYTKPRKRGRWTDYKVLTRRFRTPDRIISIEEFQEEPVISMTTTTGNYVAWGYASKNCFPDLIPMYEFWIDEAQSKKEETYFRDHMLKEWELMNKGVSYDKALSAGDEVENRLRHKGKSAKHCKARPTHEYDVGAKLLRKEGQINIWLVKGDIVRDRYDTDFTEGGHDLVYTYIPSPNNVWIDDMMVVKEREPTIIHEVTERNLMAKGEKYHPAHHLALEAEWKWRHKK